MNIFIGSSADHFHCTGDGTIKIKQKQARIILKKDTWPKVNLL
jgi:hypothetical protein